jgi:hypothetical protein
MGEGTAANINRKIKKIIVWMNELDLHISGRENLASMKKTSGEQRDCRSLRLARGSCLRGEQTSSPSVTGRANYYQR